MNIRSTLSQSEYFKNVLKLSSGTTLAHLITILISPILTRLFTPDDFGELQLFHSTIIITSLFATGCYHFIIVSPKKNNEVDALFKGLLILTIIVTSITIVIGIILYKNTHLLDNFSLLIVALFPVTLFFHSMNISLDYLFIRFERYTSISYTRVTRTSTTGFFQFLMGIIVFRNGLILGMIIGRSITTFVYLSMLGLEKIKKILSTPIYDVKEVLKKHIAQPFFILPSTLVSSGSTEVVIFLIATFFGGFELGLYALAYRVLSIPSAFIGSSVGEVFFQKSTILINDSKPIIRLVLKTWGGLFAVAFLPCLMLFFYGAEIIVFVFGENWVGTGIVTEIMAPLILFSFISAPTGKLFISLNEQVYSPYLSILILVSRLGGLYLGYLQGGFFQGISYMVAFHFIALIMFNAVMFKRILVYEKSITRS